MKLSVVIPAYNEEGCLEDTLFNFYKILDKEKFSHEVLVVNDHSRDQTEAILRKLQKELPSLRYINNSMPNGFHYPVRCGLYGGRFRFSRGFNSML